MENKFAWGDGDVSVEKPAGSAQEKVVRNFQFQNGLPVTGKLDQKTSELMKAKTQSADDVKKAASAKLDDDTLNFFRKAVS